MCSVEDAPYTPFEGIVGERGEIRGGEKVHLPASGLSEEVSSITQAGRAYADHKAIDRGTVFVEFEAEGAHRQLIVVVEESLNTDLLKGLTVSAHLMEGLLEDGGSEVEVELVPEGIVIGNSIHHSAGEAQPCEVDCTQLCAYEKLQLSREPNKHVQTIPNLAPNDSCVYGSKKIRPSLSGD